jgi:hypothetical protein
MKVISLLLSLMFSICISNAQNRQVENLKKGRIEKVINSHWTFNYFPVESADKGYESPGFNDSRWPAISLPHTWNSYETTGELRPFTRSPAETGETYWWRGWGWYRKHFTINSDLSDHKVFLEFQGVQKYCKVWINGKYAGDHKGGYGSFDFDITGYLNASGDNLLAVAVSYLQKDEFIIHPLTEGRYNVSCGIYRDVRIVLKNKLFIPMQGSASHEGGTFIATPLVSGKEGIVNVKTWVKNDYPQPKTCILQTSIAERNGQVIQVMRSEEVINPGQLFMFEQTGKPVKTPNLWSPEDPFLYTLHSEVIDKKEIVDEYFSSFGFRWLRKDDKDDSVWLNGKKTVLRGLIRNQEYPWLGDALPGWITEMDYSAISGNPGTNFIRTINYPGDEAFYYLADNLGIIAEEDFSAITLHNFSAEEQKQQIREMIRRDRNHPGIISWSAGNTADNMDNYILAAAEDSTRTIRSLQAIIDSSSRFFVYGRVGHSASPPAEIAGEPAKIIVSSSSHRINADRGSVAIIMAEVADAKGNHVPAVKKSIRWSVSGPAKLVGPEYYVSFTDSNRSSDDGYYIEMPATNILRSDGRPGKIKVTVFSSGLASGSCEIDAIEIITDNSIIIEPILSDDGRKHVARNSIVTQRLEEIPIDISQAGGDFSMGPMDKDGYYMSMRESIKKDNPAIDTSTVEFKTLAALLARQLFNNRGSLSASDYNFNAGHYNNCRLISGYIEKTKLPPLFKASLRRYYSNTIIAEGNDKNAGDEMNWLNWIPSGGIIVIVQDETVNIGQKGVVCTKHTELQDIIRTVYPQFASFSDDAKERALIFISKMNPAVNVKFLNDKEIPSGSHPASAMEYSAMKGQPILIPEYKFISE